VGALILLALGIDHLVGVIISTIVAFYFGHGAYERRRNSKLKRPPPA